MDHASDLSDREEIILSLLQVCSAMLSLIGSGAIVFTILRKLGKTKTTTPYERIMLGLSGCDILASVTYAMGPFLLPSETSGRVWATGTDHSCSRLGFLTQLACLWAVWYSALLSFYYLLTIRFQVKPREFSTKYEPWMHLSGAVFFTVTAIIGLVGNWYSEERLAMTCWIDEVPRGCREAGTPCYGLLVAVVFGGIPTAIALLALITNNIVIYVFVRKSLLSTPVATTTAKPPTTVTATAAATTATATTATATTATANGPSTTQDCEGSSMDLAVVMEEKNEEQEPSSPPSAFSSTDRVGEESVERPTVQEQLTQEVAIQGLLYVSAFLLTIIPGFVVSLLEGIGFNESDQKTLYPLLVLCSMLLPLQGFFNVFIYLKPSYSRFRTRYPDRSVVFVLNQAFFNQNIPRLTSSVGFSTTKSGRVIPGGYNNLPAIVEDISVDNHTQSTN